MSKATNVRVIYKVVRKMSELTPGKAIFTIINDVGTVYQVTVEWLDPAVTMGELIMMVSDVAVAEVGDRTYVANTLIMAMGVFRESVQEIISAGEIQPAQVRWVFSDAVARFITTFADLEPDTSSGQWMEEHRQFVAENIRNTANIVAAIQPLYNIDM